MAYDGYVEYNGSELINLSRTAQLAETLGVDSVRLRKASLAWIQTDRSGSGYNSVANAPWYDSGYPASAEFAGIIPVSVDGLDTSTLESSATEYTTDGGHSGKPRNTTLSVVFDVIIVALTERGAEFGLRWLNRRLRDSGAQVFGTGANLRYYRWGAIGSPLAHRRDVRLTRGTSITRKRNSPCAVTWFANFTMTAADPYEYGEAVPLLSGLGGPLPTNVVSIVKNPDAIGLTDISSSGTSTQTLASESTIVHHGTSSAKVTATAVPGGGSAGISFTTSEVVSGTGGARVRWTQWFYSATAATVQPYWEGIVTSTGVPVVVSGGAAVVLVANTWTKISGDVTLPADRTLRRVAVLNSAAVLNDVYYSDECIAWVGTATAPPALVSEGSQASLAQASCPTYNYDPIYDPLYPALIAPPKPPDTLPDGWNIATGQTFTRYWARVTPQEPSGMVVIPTITVSGTSDARRVRVSLWASTKTPTDQCAPLFSVIVGYLPPNQTLYVDGEQKATYTWDGISPAVRRADSIVYGPDASPVQWSAFSDHTNFLVTLDIFDLPGPTQEGVGTVRAALSLTPKSD